MENFNQVVTQTLSNPLLLMLFVIWSIFWKGMALWKSSQKKHLVWFIILLLVNTLGLLEIAYIFYLNRWELDNGRLLAFFDKRRSQSKRKN